MPSWCDAELVANRQLVTQSLVSLSRLRESRGLSRGEGLPWKGCPIAQREQALPGPESPTLPEGE